MTTKQTRTKDSQEQRLAERFGALVRQRREALKLRQDDLALAANVGRRFIVELEAGKPNCQLGKALAVAAAVGLKAFKPVESSPDALLPDLPELKDEPGA
ncbi:helix-turn-helix domain-containing protein [Rhodomicrobium sp. Az07]|uniref:helix-turn-helix domain-containing protein n=1 Tax=Rhodomicrobium sp. Az07 TaxID=2839034 RepID=UPI001BEA593E|nr:helix-turn-helix domain-containing protein [Rhodomicrobium sp. Az07]MBT3071952.1 helix-turn-helix domain-containing protein [Rhodomicrobium sp. Az07]